MFVFNELFFFCWLQDLKKNLPNRAHATKRENKTTLRKKLVTKNKPEHCDHRIKKINFFSLLSFSHGFRVPRYVYEKNILWGVKMYFSSTLGQIGEFFASFCGSLKTALRRVPPDGKTTRAGCVRCVVCMFSRY